MLRMDTTGFNGTIQSKQQLVNPFESIDANINGDADAWCEWFLTRYYAELITLHWDKKRDRAPLGFIQFLPFPFPLPISGSVRCDWAITLEVQIKTRWSMMKGIQLVIRKKTPLPYDTFQFRILIWPSHRHEPKFYYNNCVTDPIISISYPYKSLKLRNFFENKNESWRQSQSFYLNTPPRQSPTHESVCLKTHSHSTTTTATVIDIRNGLNCSQMGVFFTWCGSNNRGFLKLLPNKFCWIS